MMWEFETPDGHTVRVVVSAEGVAVSTRLVNGALDGEVFDLETFEHTVLPGMDAYVSAEVIDAIRAALRDAIVARDRADDEVP